VRIANMTWRPVPSSSKSRNTLAMAALTDSSGVHHDAVFYVVDVADGKSLAQLSLGRLMAQSCGQSVTDEVQLGFGHRPFQAEDEAGR